MSDCSRIKLGNEPLKRGRGIHICNAEDHGITHLPAQWFHLATVPWLPQPVDLIMVAV
jgi:hypothetical protein